MAKAGETVVRVRVGCSVCKKKRDMDPNSGPAPPVRLDDTHIHTPKLPGSSPFLSPPLHPYTTPTGRFWVQSRLNWDNPRIEDTEEVGYKKDTIKGKNDPSGSPSSILLLIDSK